MEYLGMQWVFLFVFFTLLVAKLIVALAHHVGAAMLIAFAGVIITLD